MNAPNGLQQYLTLSDEELSGLARSWRLWCLKWSDSKCARSWPQVDRQTTESVSRALWKLEMSEQVINITCATSNQRIICLGYWYFLGTCIALTDRWHIKLRTGRFQSNKCRNRDQRATRTFLFSADRARKEIMASFLASIPSRSGCSCRMVGNWSSMYNWTPVSLLKNNKHVRMLVRASNPGLRSDAHDPPLHQRTIRADQKIKAGDAVAWQGEYQMATDVICNNLSTNFTVSSYDFRVDLFKRVTH